MVVCSSHHQTSRKDAVLDNRLKNIIAQTTQLMYGYTCTGIFEVHKLMFSFQMTTMIMEGNLVPTPSVARLFSFPVCLDGLITEILLFPLV